MDGKTETGDYSQSIPSPTKECLRLRLILMENNDQGNLLDQIKDIPNDKRRTIYELLDILWGTIRACRRRRREGKECY